MKGVQVVSKQAIGDAPIGTLFRVQSWIAQSRFYYDVCSVEKKGIHYIGYSNEFLNLDEMNEDFNGMFSPVIN